MKIPRPQTPETPFKRKRGPPPQATKLLIASLSAGLVFMALLAIVFVPRYLENANPPPSTVLFLNYTTASGSPRIVVTSANNRLNLSLFNATVTRDNVTVASLATGLGGSSNGFSFADANHNGLLDTGDYFTLPSGPQGTYRITVFQVDLNYRVGYLAWTGA